METWEYMTSYSKFNGVYMEDKFNIFGKNGWELVSTVSDLSGHSHYVLSIFKRKNNN